MISVVNTILDEIPGEHFFTSHLQDHLTFTVNDKVLRKGRLLIFKRTHYYIQITTLSHKNTQDCFEIPIPFKTEYYPEDGLMYFDYRLKTLAGSDTDLEYKLFEKTIKSNPSPFFNKILEIQYQETPN